jgi:hypothetical protein
MLGTRDETFDATPEARKAAAEILLRAVKVMSAEGRVIAEYRGFGLHASMQPHPHQADFIQPIFRAIGPSGAQYAIHFETVDGLYQSFDYLLDRGLPKFRLDQADQLADTQRRHAAMLPTLQDTFTRQDELDQAVVRLAEIDALLLKSEQEGRETIDVDVEPTRPTALDVSQDNFRRMQDEQRRRADAPDFEAGAEGGQAGALALPFRIQFGRSTPAGIPPIPPSVEPDVEEATTSSRSPDRTALVPGLRGLTETIRETAQQAVTDAFVYEPLLRQFPVEREAFRRFKAAPDRALEGASRDVRGVVGLLADRNELDLFGRLVVLRDLASRAAQPDRFTGGMPAGITSEQIAAEMERLGPFLTTNVEMALDAHDRLMTAEFEDLVERGLKSETDRIESYYPHMVLDKQPEKTPAPGRPRAVKQPFRPYTVRAHGSALLIETDYVTALFQHRMKVRLDNAIDDFALEILRRHDHMRQLPEDERTALKPDDLWIDPQTGKRYRAYQYRNGRMLFPAFTVEEWALRQGMANAQAILAEQDDVPAEGISVQIPVDAIRKRAAMGRYYRIYLLPESIAERFKTLVPEPAIAGVRLLNDLTRVWKRMTVAFWGTAGNILNLEGDLFNWVRQAPGPALPAIAAGAAIGGAVGGPAGAFLGGQAGLLFGNPWHYKAALAIWKWRQGNGDALQAMLEEADVLRSTFVRSPEDLYTQAPELVQFLTDTQQRMRQAKDRIPAAAAGAFIGGLTAGIPGAAAGAALGGLVGWRRLFDTIPEIREQIPRVSMAMYQLDRIRRGLPVRGRGIDIHGLPPQDAALKIARQAMVDYRWLTPLEERYLNGLAFPFYAFAAKNATNWLRYLVSAPVGVMALVGMRMLLELWNNGDDERRKVEQALSDYQRGMVHLVTGWKDDAGKMIVLFLAGDPLADMLGYLGLGNTAGRLSDVVTGRLTPSQGVRQQMTAFISEPVGRMIGLANPLGRTPTETYLNKKAFGSGVPITPRALEDTSEDLRRRARHVVESFFRPLRESRLLLEQGAGEKGIDPLTQRYLGGLPFTRVDPAGAAIRTGMGTWADAMDRYVETIVEQYRQSDAYARLPPRQRALAVERLAEQTRKDFLKWGLPVPGLERFGQRMKEAR